MDMVERVATAIVASIKAQLGGHPIPGVPPASASWTASGGTIDGNALARAAIEAMREPTEPMRFAAGNLPISYDDGHDTDEVWRTMIDAALISKQP